MKAGKRKRLRKAGWKIGSADELLGLSAADAAAVEEKLQRAVGAHGPWQRISVDPQVLGGKACIRGTRVTVALVLDLLASGQTKSAVLAAFPELEAEDVREAVAYATEIIRGMLAEVEHAVRS